MDIIQKENNNTPTILFKYHPRDIPYFLKADIFSAEHHKCGLCGILIKPITLTHQLNNDFVNYQTIVVNFSPVVCNITANDVNIASHSIHSLKHYKDKITTIIAEHHTHFMHLSCGQRWIRHLFDSEQVIQCPVNHDVFYSIK